jgi:hypothetical protein
MPIANGLDLRQNVPKRMLVTIPICLQKPVTFHFSLLIAVIVYAFMGGLVFNYLESSAFHEAKRVVRANRSACVRQTLIDNRQLVLLLNSTNDAVVDAIVDCWQSEADVRNEWSYMTATLYGFGVITTLGMHVFEVVP